MDFKDYLMKKYRLAEKSADDYVGRYHGLVESGIYKGEKEVTPEMSLAIEKEYPQSINHYYLTLKRYVDFIQKI